MTRKISKLFARKNVALIWKISSEIVYLIHANARKISILRRLWSPRYALQSGVLPSDVTAYLNKLIHKFFLKPVLIAFIHHGEHLLNISGSDSVVFFPTRAMSNDNYRIYSNNMWDPIKFWKLWCACYSWAIKYSSISAGE